MILTYHRSSIFKFEHSRILNNALKTLCFCCRLNPDQVYSKLFACFYHLHISFGHLTEGKHVSPTNEEGTKDHALHTHEHESHYHESGVGEEEGSLDWGSGSGSGSGRNLNLFQ